MTVDVSVTVPGRLDPERIASALRDMGARDVDVEHRGRILDVDYFSVTFGNPYKSRQSREMRCHVATGGDPEMPSHEYIGYGEYTYMTLGQFDAAENIMETLARRFGGWLEADEGPLANGRWMGDEAALSPASNPGTPWSP